jgi:hypothetical protein
MCEEDRREVDPSAEWLSRQDLRNDWVRTPFMARCIIRSRSCTWAATPTAGQGRASSRRRRSGNTIPSRPPNGCRALVADAGRETDHPPSDPGYRHLRLFPEAACSDCLHHRRTTAFWLEDGQRFRQRPTRRRISAPAPGAPENVRSGPWRAEAREVATVEVPRHCDQTHHTRQIGPRRVRSSRQLGELAHSVQAGEAGADYDHLKLPRDGAGQGSARWN